MGAASGYGGWALWSHFATARHSKDVDVFLTATEAAVDDTVDGLDLVIGAYGLCRGPSG
jgi:hypothetical protein